MLALILTLVLQDEILKESDHELAPDAAVTVRTVVGRVRLRGTDKKEAHVRSVKRGRDRDLVEITVEASKDKLNVEARFPERSRDLQIEIEIDVDLPRSIKSLGAKVVSGTIDVKDAKGDSTLESVSGSITVDGLQGDLSATTISGKIRIAKLVGTKASVSATSGTVEGSGELKELVIKSVSGGASFDVTPKGEGWTVQASCISGNVRLGFPDKAGAKIELKTISGDLGSDFDLKDVRTGGRGSRLSGAFGDGAGKVTATTVSGGVRIARLK